MGYKASFSNSGKSGGGPRVDFGTDSDAEQFLVVGAYDTINNIDTKNRPLKIFSATSATPISVQVVNLPHASTAPAGTKLAGLAIDSATGQLYVLG